MLYRFCFYILSLFEKKPSNESSSQVKNDIIELKFLYSPEKSILDSLTKEAKHEVYFCNEFVSNSELRARVYEYFAKKFKTEKQKHDISVKLFHLAQNSLLKSMLYYKELMIIFPENLYLKFIFAFIIIELRQFRIYNNKPCPIDLVNSFEFYNRFAKILSNFENSYYGIRTIKFNSLIDYLNHEIPGNSIKLKKTLLIFFQPKSFVAKFNPDRLFKEILKKTDHDDFIVLSCYNLYLKKRTFHIAPPINFKKLKEDFTSICKRKSIEYIPSNISEYLSNICEEDLSLNLFMDKKYSIFKKFKGFNPSPLFFRDWESKEIIRFHVRAYLEHKRVWFREDLNEDTVLDK